MTLDLPRALHPWREQLALFPPELALSLGPLVSRLALAVGPLRAQVPQPGAEPDGFDGLDRRGSYERLLAGEWLLAEEAPDEFARRAASGEHAFLRLARRAPRGARRAVALFDAGPSQLGGPRIAQLAALVTLAARAAAAGAHFGWGALQGDHLFTELTAASVRTLLAARTAREPTPADLLGWTERLGGPAGRPDDLWLVGAPRLAAMPRGQASLLLAEDVVEPGARRVRVRVQARGRAGAPVELELPPPQQAVRLLRDPFEAGPARPAAVLKLRPSGTGGLQFAPGGRWVLTRLDDGAVMAQPIPNSPNAPPGNALAAGLHKGERLVAAGFAQRRLALVTLRDGVPFLRETGRRGGPAGRPVPLTPHPDKPFGALPDCGPGLLPLLRHRIGEGSLRSEETFFLAADGRLFTVLGGSMALPIASGVRAVAPFYGQLAWVAEAGEGGGPLRRRLEVHDGFTGKVIPCDLGGDGPLDAFLGFGGGLNARGLGGVAAVRHRAEAWRLVYGAGGPETHPELPDPAPGRVVGVARDGRAGGAIALVVREPDGRGLSLVSEKARRALPRAGAEIVQAAASPEDALVAWLTREGELCVYALDQDAFLVRRRAEGGEG